MGWAGWKLFPSTVSHQTGCSPAGKTSVSMSAAVLGIRIRIRMFLGLLDPDPDPFVRETDPGSGSFPFLINVLKYCLQNKILTQNFGKKSNFLDWRSCACGQFVRKKYENKICFCILKINEERIWIRIHYSEVRIRGPGSGSASKCHGSTTPVSTKESVSWGLETLIM